MKKGVLELLSPIFACIVVRFAIHHQNLEFPYTQMCNNLAAFLQTREIIEASALESSQ
jgi:hypothetical protein